MIDFIHVYISNKLVFFANTQKIECIVFILSSPYKWFCILQLFKKTFTIVPLTFIISILQVCLIFKGISKQLKRLTFLIKIFNFTYFITYIVQIWMPKVKRHWGILTWKLILRLLGETKKEALLTANYCENLFLILILM